MWYRVVSRHDNPASYPCYKKLPSGDHFSLNVSNQQLQLFTELAVADLGIYKGGFQFRRWTYPLHRRRKYAIVGGAQNLWW